MCFVFRLLLPAAYALTWGLLIFGPLNPVAHGPGLEIAWKLALPASLLLLLGGNIVVLLFLGICQWALIGYALDCLVVYLEARDRRKGKGDQ